MAERYNPDPPMMTEVLRAMVDGNALETRERIMAAVIACAGSGGLRGLSMADVASAASVSRTTIYRYFPDGRNQLLTETATWEIARFWARVADAVAGFETLEDRLVAGLVIGRRMMSRSRILTNLNGSDVGDLLEVSQPSDALMRGLVASYIRSGLEDEIETGRARADLDLDLTADYLARMAISWIANSPGLDLEDDPAVRRIVRTQFLAGIMR